jgi:hypothetical protein
MTEVHGLLAVPKGWIEIIGSADLPAAVDQVIPPDIWPGGWERGVCDYLLDCGTELRWAEGALTRLVDELHRRHFAVAAPDEQDRVLHTISQGPGLGAARRM